MMFQATFQEQDFFFSTRKRPRRTQDELDPDERRKRFLERNRWVHATLFVNNSLIQHFSEM